MQKPEMLRFDVWLNGKQLCRAGMPGDGVLTSILSWVKRDPAKRPDGVSARTWMDGTTTISVGGSFGGLHRDWVRHRRLRTGDTLRVRIVRARDADRPVRSRLFDPGTLESKRQDLRNLEASAKRIRADIRRLSRTKALA